MSDLIDRQAAIDAFWSLDAELRPSAIDAILNMLKDVPSAQPEPPEDICGECDAWNKYKSERKGKWIWDENGMDWGLGAWCCSECGTVEYFNKGWKKFSYCPNCGAYMQKKGEDDELQTD